MAEQLQAQERALSRKLEERLADVGKRVGDSLEKSSQTAQTTIADLKERLAVIDAAQKNITSLSSQVVGLPDILANKQRSEEHTSELQSLMSISYADFCLKNKKNQTT